MKQSYKSFPEQQTSAKLQQGGGRGGKVGVFPGAPLQKSIGQFTSAFCFTDSRRKSRPSRLINAAHACTAAINHRRFYYGLRAASHRSLVTPSERAARTRLARDRPAERLPADRRPATGTSAALFTTVPRWRGFSMRARCFIEVLPPLSKANTLARRERIVVR